MFIALILSMQWSGAQTKERYEFSAPKMGTHFRIVVYAADSNRVEEAVQAAFERIDRLNQIMSDYDPQSEISRLADSAAINSRRYYPVSEDLWNVLALAKVVSRKSNGAFDVTVGPLSRLWRRAFRRRIFPGDEDIAQARLLVNHRWLKLRSSDRSVRLCKAGMRLDLGGIAKGYAVDAAYAVLQTRGLDTALVDGGGDIYAGAPPPGEHGWRILRNSLLGDSVANEILLVQNGAIATSGDTYRYLEWEGKRYAHLIDPRTGLGMTERRMTSVGAANCMLADAMASALSVADFTRLEPLAQGFNLRYHVIYLGDDGKWKEIKSRF